MDDKTYEAIGMLLRGVVWHEQSGGRTPEHLAGQIRRAVAVLSPAIAAEVERDGAARVYAERWDDAGGMTREQQLEAARNLEPDVPYGAVGAGRYDREAAPIHVTVTGPPDRGTTPIARAILEMLQEADVRCSMPEETENPYDGDSIEQLGNLRRDAGLRVVVQTRGVDRGPR